MRRIGQYVKPPVPYKSSEIRLVKALDGVCEQIDKKDLKQRTFQQYCFEIIEDNEDSTLMSWFKQVSVLAEEDEGTAVRLFDVLCSRRNLGEKCRKAVAVVDTEKAVADEAADAQSVESEPVQDGDKEKEDL